MQFHNFSSAISSSNILKCSYCLWNVAEELYVLTVTDIFNYCYNISLRKDNLMLFFFFFSSPLAYLFAVYEYR